MCNLLEQMEQCLYQLKHATPVQEMRIRGAIADTEIALANLIRIMESTEKSTKTKKETK